MKDERFEIFCMKKLFLIVTMSLAGLSMTAQPSQDSCIIESQISNLKPQIYDTSQTSNLNSQIKREFDILFHEALLQRQKGHLDASFDLLLRCKELCPEAAETYYYIGDFYDDMERKEEALAAFRRACDLEPTNMTFLERMAYASIQSGAYAEGAAMVEQMYEADKSRQDLLDMLYQLYFQEKDYEKAIGVLDRMEAADGPSERTTLSKCRIYIEQNDADKAISEMRQLAEHYPNDPTYRTLYANTLLVVEHEQEC